MDLSTLSDDELAQWHQLNVRPLFVAALAAKNKWLANSTTNNKADSDAASAAFEAAQSLWWREAERRLR